MDKANQSDNQLANLGSTYCNRIACKSKAGIRYRTLSSNLLEDFKLKLLEPKFGCQTDAATEKLIKSW